MEETIVILRAYPGNYNIQETANYSLTVGELIDELSRLPQDAKVIYQRNNDSIYCDFDITSIKEVKINQEK